MLRDAEILIDLSLSSESAMLSRSCASSVTAPFLLELKLPNSDDGQGASKLFILRGINLGVLNVRGG